MKILLHCALAAFIAIIFTACSSDKNNAPVSSTSNSDSPYIIAFKANAGGIQSDFSSETIVRQIQSQYQISSDKVTAIWNRAIKGFAANLTPDQLNRLRKDDRILTIEYDQVITLGDQVETTKGPGGGGSGGGSTQTTPWGITFVGGTTIATSTSGVAWIVDTGIDLTHPDLNVNTTLAKTFVPSGTDSRSATDNNGHGSHCAGIVGAKNNTIGVVGVCAGAQVIPVKVLDRNGSGQWSWIISGLDYVAANLVPGKMNVVNLSLGGSPSSTVDAAVTNVANAGAYVSIAAGNDGLNAANYTPARVNGATIFTVSAHSNGNWASFSNWGNPPVDFCAPGVSVYSCYKGGGYATMSGTSMAAPHVAGLLLAIGNGTVNFSGYVANDPDGNADPLAHK